MFDVFNIKAVIYDMDGVIVDSEPLWKEAEINVFKTLGIQLTTEDCELTRGFRTDEVIQYWYERTPWKGKSVKEVTENLIDEVKLLIESKGLAFPGLHSSIKVFKNKGFQLAICTSSHPVLIDTVLNKFDIANEFNIVQSAFECRFGKPHPEVYLKTASKLEVLPSHCLVIEDSISGMISSKAAKMLTIVKPDKSQFNLPQWSIADLKISSLESIPELLNE